MGVAVLFVGSLFADLLLYDQKTSRTDAVKLQNRHFLVPCREIAAVHVDFLELDLAKLTPRLLAGDPIHRGDGWQLELADPPNDFPDAAAKLLGDHVYVRSTINKDPQDTVGIKRPVHGRAFHGRWSEG